MKHSWLILGCLAVAIVLLGWFVDAQGSEPEITPTGSGTGVVRFLLFYSETCPHCHEIMENYLPAVYAKYGDRVEREEISIYNNTENYTRMLALEQKLKVPQSEQGFVPTLIIGDQVLIGGDQIPARLEDLIDQYLAQGGVDYTTLDQQTPLRPAAEASPAAESQPIYMAYFEKAGCQECARTEYDLQVVQEQYPQVVVERFPIEESDNKLLNAWLSEKYQVPEASRLSTPMVFVGETVLIGSEANLDSLLAAVESHAAAGAGRTWEDFDPEEGKENILGMFGQFGVLGVLGAGLIDGLNPCAFATLVFFISYLTFTGRRGRDILLVGASFALGVFLTYLLVGVGLLNAIQALPFFTALGRWVYLLTALLCMALAALTFRDYARARKGKTGEMTLKLPLALRKRINQVIREGSQARAFVAVAFVTGFVISLIELACTGQVYLPTIIYVLSVPELAAQAFFYLLLYCIMFIVPLIVVFVLAYRGTTSEQLAQFVGRHTASIKLVTGLLFTALAMWMVWTLAPLFGVEEPWTWVLLAEVPVLVALIASILEARSKKKDKRRPVAHRQRRRSRV